MKWAGHVACMTEITKCIQIWLEGLEGRDHLENIGIKKDLQEIGTLELRFLWIRIENVGGLL